MGYRSDLVVLIYPDVEHKDDVQAKYDQLKLLMATTFKDVTEEFSAYMEWLDKDHVLKFDIPDVKWYPSYSDVIKFEAMKDAFSGDDLPGYSTEFVRIGEDSTDIEEDHTGDHNHYYLSVRREIECNI